MMFEEELIEIQKEYIEKSNIKEKFLNKEEIEHLTEILKLKLSLINNHISGKEYFNSENIINQKYFK